MRDTDPEIISGIVKKALGKATQTETINKGVSSDIYKIKFEGRVAYLKLSDSEIESLFPEYMVYKSLKEVGVKPQVSCSLKMKM
ncbi:hypothetical protein HY045_01215 [Candidatus Woesebacteria bacterium]|nr:hypothetical protein [Candidatus Woesebacteria bacterium]